ncbi:MAG: hypothetical protein WBV61_00240 [Rhodanobacteraceae bacterium]
MNEFSLSRLYRRLTAHPQLADSALLDADALVAAAETGLPAGERDSVAHALSRSSSHSALLRMLHELRGDSVSLANQIAGTRQVAHPMRVRANRRAAGAQVRSRRSRIVGGLVALAACLVAVVGVWSTHTPTIRDVGSGALTIQVAHRPDRIFTSEDKIFNAEMGHALASESSARRNPDHVFRSGFTGI